MCISLNDDDQAAGADWSSVTRMPSRLSAIFFHIQQASEMTWVTLHNTSVKKVIIPNRLAQSQW